RGGPQDPRAAARRGADPWRADRRERPHRSGHEVAVAGAELVRHRVGPLSDQGEYGQRRPRVDHHRACRRGHAATTHQRDDRRGAAHGQGGRVSERFLTPMQFDFLWEQLRLGEYPYPLQVRSHGRTMDERIHLRHRVERELKSLGVKNSYGEVDPRLDTWLRTLAFPRVSVDAAHIPEFKHPPVCAVAASDGENAVLVKQTQDGISFRPIFPEALASEIISLLPPGERGTAGSITLSLDDALRTKPALVKVGGPEEKSEEKEKAEAQSKSRFGLFRKEPEKPKPEPPRRRPLSERTAGSPQEDYAMLLAQPRLRGGQLAANARDEAGRKFRSPALAWFDTVTGRYLSLSRTGPDGHEWITVSGADVKTLRSRLAELVSSVQAQAS